jgi:hypothetical protein
MNEPNTLVALTDLRRRDTTAARELTRFALAQKHEAEAVWQDTQQVLHGGATGDEAREVLGIARSVIDSWFALAQRVRDLWRDIPAATGAMPELLAELGQAEVTGIACPQHVCCAAGYDALSRPWETRESIW